MVQCVYEALLECPVICLSLSHCSYEERWHSLPAPGSETPCHLDVFGDTGEVAYLQLEALRRAVVGSAADWQLASVRRYVAVGLSSCPFGFSSLDGFDDLLCLQAGC